MDFNDYHRGAELDAGEGAILDYAVIRTMNVDVRLAVEWVMKNIWDQMKRRCRILLYLVSFRMMKYPILEFSSTYYTSPLYV